MGLTMKLTIKFGQQTFLIELSDEAEKNDETIITSISASAPVTSPTFSQLRRKILEQIPALKRESGFKVGLTSQQALDIRETDSLRDYVVSGDRIFIFDAVGRNLRDNFLSDFSHLKNSENQSDDHFVSKSVFSNLSEIEVNSTICTSESGFGRPFLYLAPNEPNRLRLLCESTDEQVPASFQAAWLKLLEERKGNVGILDGFVFISDILMWEEGFHKIQPPDGEEKETPAIRRSYYSHLSPSSLAVSDYFSCMLIFSAFQNGQKLLIQSVLRKDFRSQMPPDDKLPSLNIPSTTRYWISNVFGGHLRMRVLEMYRNLLELTILIKDSIVLKLQAIIAHGLDPPVLVGLESMPPEILEKIVLTCRPEDAANLSQTCRRLHNVMQSDAVWRSFARDKFAQFRGLSDSDIRENHGSWRQVFIAEFKASRQEHRDEENRRSRNFMQPIYRHSSLWPVYPVEVIPHPQYPPDVVFDPDLFEDEYF